MFYTCQAALDEPDAGYAFLTEIMITPLVLAAALALMPAAAFLLVKNNPLDVERRILGDNMREEGNESRRVYRNVMRFQILPPWRRNVGRNYRLHKQIST